MRLRLALALAFASGFISLSYELLWYRLFSMANGAQASSFPLLLGAFLLGLALGAAWAQRYCEQHGEEEGRQLRRVAAFFVGAYLLAYLTAPLFALYAEHVPVGARAPWLALSAAFLGVVFPLLAHFAIAPDERAGRAVSWLYGANIVGSVLGSALTGYVLLDVTSLATVSGLLLATALLLGALTFTAPRGARAMAVAAAVALPLGGVAVWASPALHDRVYERLQFGDRYGRDFHFTRVVENRNGVITVGPDDFVYGGGTYDGAFNLDPRDPKNGIQRAYQVAALHPAPREVLMIGLSTGSWAQVVANLPGVEHLTVVEINPGYLPLIEEHPQVASLLKHPKVTLVTDDGRRWLMRNPERRFDVIVSNNSVHWSASSSHLLSAEFLALIQRHLKPGGVYAFNSTGSYRAQRTAALVFPQTLALDAYVVASEQPIDLSIDRMRRSVEAMSVDGSRPFDPATGDGRSRWEALRHATPAPTPRELLLSRSAGREPITDDNMGQEWEL